MNFSQIFIGGLRDDANRYDIEDSFGKYGKVGEAEKKKK